MYKIPTGTKGKSSEVVTIVAVTFLCCFGSAFGNLRQLAYEGSCSYPPGKFASNLDLNWITTIPKLYISYGSLQYWVQNAEAHLGMEPLTLAVLSNMDSKTEWDLNSTVTCFGRSISQQCNLNPHNGNPFVSCNVISFDTGTDPTIYKEYKKRVVLTDNKTFALFVRCVNGLRSYYIASPFPTISEKAILESIFEIIKLGFDVTLFTKVPSREVDCGGGVSVDELGPV